MRFAYAGIDMFAGVFDTLLAAGWQPLKLFTRPCDGIVDFNDQVILQARRQKLPIQISRLSRMDIAALADRGCECLVVAGYPWLVTGWEGLLPYAFNIHPSPLPEGRGPYPLMRALLEDRREWGVTAHALADSFDTGPILAQHRFPVSPADNHDSLLARCQIGAARLAAAIAADLPGSWRNAKPQGSGSYWKRTTDAERVLEWNKGVAHVLSTIRAFGSLETIAYLDGSMVHVSAATGWIEEHGLPTGRIVHRYQRQLTVTASDGFLILARWSPISLHDAANLGR